MSPVINAGSFNWDILRIFHEIKNSIRKCALSEDKDIASIAIDTWGVDYGFLNKNGKLISNPYHYRDERTAGVPEEAFKTISQDELYGITGTQTMNFNTVFQLLAEKRDNPEIFDIARDMLFCSRSSELLSHPELRKMNIRSHRPDRFSMQRAATGRLT